jgi:hypothetical protein
MAHLKKKANGHLCKKVGHLVNTTCAEVPPTLFLITLDGVTPCCHWGIYNYPDFGSSNIVLNDSAIVDDLPVFTVGGYGYMPNETSVRVPLDSFGHYDTFPANCAATLWGHLIINMQITAGYTGGGTPVVNGFVGSWDEIASGMEYFYGSGPASTDDVTVSSEEPACNPSGGYGPNGLAIGGTGGTMRIKIYRVPVLLDGYAVGDHPGYTIGHGGGSVDIAVTAPGLWRTGKAYSHAGDGGGIYLPGDTLDNTGGDISFFNISTTGGTGNDTVTVTMPPNTTGYPRGMYLVINNNFLNVGQSA